MRIRESAAFIKGRIVAPIEPLSELTIASVAVVLGSGLGDFADSLQDSVVVPYGDIPHFPRSTAPGHKGRMVIGTLPSPDAGGFPPPFNAVEFSPSPDAGEILPLSPESFEFTPPKARGNPQPRVICLQGRFHLYEGYSLLEATWYVRVLKELGVTRLILTNASGGMEPAWNVGDLMLITDHINYMFQNPLTGPNLSEYGPRFPDMTHAYDPALLDEVRSAAADLSIRLREGVYVGFCGPSYETPAEIRMFRTLGVSAVGMSTVPEAIAANHCGIKTCGISCITNYAAGILDQPLTEEEVVETAVRTGPVFRRLLRNLIARLLS